MGKIQNCFWVKFQTSTLVVTSIQLWKTKEGWLENIGPSNDVPVD
jgi:hypothetical protein